MIGRKLLFKVGKKAPIDPESGIFLLIIFMSLEQTLRYGAQKKARKLINLYNKGACLGPFFITKKRLPKKYL